MATDNIKGSNVFSMYPRRHQQKFGASAQVEGYWHALCHQGIVPKRSQIDPRGLEDVLEYAFILEHVAPGVGRIRLAGMHLNDLMGMDVRGMPLTAMFLPEARQTISNALETVCGKSEVVKIALHSPGGIGRPAIEARMLLAPLRDDFDQVNRVLGCLQSVGEIGRAPRRFDVSGAVSKPVGIAVSPDAQLNELAETGVPFRGPSHMKRPDDIRPVLKLVKNDD